MKKYDYYLDKAKEAQGFKYDNQIDNALGFKASMACILRKGKAHLSEEKMIELAKLANEDEVVALIDYHIMRSNGAARKTYMNVLNRIQSHVSGFVLVALSALIMSGTSSANATNINVDMDKHSNTREYTLSHQ